MKPHRPDAPAASGGSLVAAAKRVAAEIAREASRRDLERQIPESEAALVRRHALQTARVPRRYGGPEASFGDLARIMMHLAEGDPNLAQMLQPHFVLLDWLEIDATEDQRRHFYGRVLAGEIITNAFAERGTKTPGHFATTLRRDGTGYRLDGTKFYSTGSLIADGLYILATLEGGGMALAVIPKTRAGVEIVDDWDGMGQRTTASGTTRLVSVAVAADEVVPLPNWGKKRSHIGAAAQISHAAIDAGIARAALADAVAYARTWSRPVAESGVDRATDDPYVLHSVGEMSVIAHGAEAMVLRAAEILDATLAGLGKGSSDDDERLYAEASIAVAEAKAASNVASLQLGEMMFRVAGASSTLRSHNLDRHWRNARTHTTHDPVAYKYKAIGNFLLNDRLPPISTKI
ncbi:MAG: acyl-CoA dehydrogenase family protein [Reyranellaceae bacterium]